MSGSQQNTKVNREDFYKKSVAIINNYFDNKLLKRSFFTSKDSIEHARTIELANIENQFFGRTLKE